MSEPTCVCGIVNNVDNCERCRLIAQLTAAQQRVAELERAIATVNRHLSAGDVMSIDALTADNARLTQDIKWLLESSANEFAEMEADNARLRELLRECDEALLMPFFSDLKDRIEAAIGDQSGPHFTNTTDTFGNPLLNDEVSNADARQQ